jgi:hypothetical protein
MLPLRVAGDGTTFMPHITALAGLVPWALSGDQADVAVALAARFVVGADRQQARVFALRAGVGLQGDRGEAGDLASHCSSWEEHRVAARLLGGRERMQRANSGQDTGNISLAALSFIVHEPSGIIEWQSERSLPRAVGGCSGASRARCGSG